MIKVVKIGGNVIDNEAALERFVADFAALEGEKVLVHGGGKLATRLAEKLEIPTIVSMNPIMVDGTGMCGACRLQVGNEIKFACVDGPEFDGHLVDFDQAMKRQQMYKSKEGRALLKEIEGNTHHGGCGHCGGDE